MLTAHRIAGWASFAAWLPVTLLGLLMSFSILVFVGVPTVVIGSVALITSVRAACGKRRALVAIVIGALPLLGWALVPLLVAHSTPEGSLEWTLWAAELTLATVSVGAGLSALNRRSRTFAWTDRTPR